jgi:hypothetical protein
MTNGITGRLSALRGAAVAATLAVALAGATPGPWIVLSGSIVAAIVLAGPAYRYARRRRAAGE